MPNQNFKNHTRFVPLYHFITLPAILILLVWSSINLYKSLSNCTYTDAGLCTALLLFLMSFVLLFVCFFARSSALKAHDKAIRAEENFRHFVATGKTLDSRLRMGQIVALRFAGDDEFVALAKQAADGNLSAKEIKMAIQNWKADYNRV